MNARITINFNRFPQIMGELTAGAPRVTQATAKKVAEDAKTRAPVRTGALRNSIVASGSGMQATISVGVRYGQFVEFGTHKHGAAQPYLIPALHAAGPFLFTGLRALIK